MAMEPLTESRHETVLDVTEEQIAQVYAQGFLGAVAKADNVEELVEELESIVKDVLNVHPRFERSLSPAFMSNEDRVSMLDRVFGPRVSKPVLNLLKVLSAHGRVASLRSVVRQVRKLYGRQTNRIDVDVRTAMPLADDILDSIRTTLQARLGIQPTLHVAIDPEVLGGLIVKVGDTVYDGSIRTMFEKARRRMVDRAVETIEMRPQVFISGVSGE